MADRSNFAYTPGRGIPTYLLDRTDIESRNFIDNESNITTTGDAISHMSSSILDCFPSYSISLADGASNNENRCLINTAQKEGNEVSMPSNISLMAILFPIPLCLTEDATKNTSPPSSDNNYCIVRMLFFYEIVYSGIN